MHPEHQRKAHELIDLMASNMKIEVERLYRSGAVDVESYSPDTFRLAKMLVTVAARNTRNIFDPHAKSTACRDMTNLMKF